MAPADRAWLIDCPEVADSEANNEGNTGKVLHRAASTAAVLANRRAMYFAIEHRISGSQLASQE